MPDEVVSYSGDKQREFVVHSNELQKRLFKEWESMIELYRRPDVCILLGDLIDGPNKRSIGFELWTSSLHQQIDTATDLLKMVKARKHFGVQGSYYHVSENTSSDLVVVNNLPNGEFGTDLTVEIEGKRIHCAHDIGWSQSPVSKSTRPLSELVSARLFDDRYGTFDLMLRGHRHEYLDLSTRLGRVVIAPCWKCRDSFAARKGIGLCPDLGYLYMEIGSEIDIICHRFDLNSEAYVRCVT